MEGELNKSHTTIGFRKVHTIAFLGLGVTNKYTFMSARAEFGEG